jgi:hypothetical protein
VTTLFVPDDFEVPLESATNRFRLEPLGPKRNERDHEAVDVEHRPHPGHAWFPDGKWPTGMSTEHNLADLVRHAGDFAARTGFTYSVLDGDEVIGSPSHDTVCSSHPPGRTLPIRSGAART